MAKRGRRAKSKARAELTGPSRAKALAKVVRLPLPPGLAAVARPHPPPPPEGPEDAPTPPAWLGALAREVWHGKLDRYRKRGQSVRGFEDAFAILCAKESELITRAKGDGFLPAAEVSAWRILAESFYETPAAAAAGLVAEPAQRNPFTEAAEAARV